MRNPTSFRLGWFSTLPRNSFFFFFCFFFSFFTRVSFGSKARGKNRTHTCVYVRFPYLYTLIYKPYNNNVTSPCRAATGRPKIDDGYRSGGTRSSTTDAFTGNDHPGLPSLPKREFSGTLCRRVLALKRDYRSLRRRLPTRTSKTVDASLLRHTFTNLLHTARNRVLTPSL